MESRDASSSNFWTTGVVVVALIALHFARHQFVTPPYERQMMMLFDYHKDAEKNSKILVQSSTGSEKSHSHGVITSPDHQGRETLEQYETPLYEDEFLFVFSKPTASIKPKTYVEIRQYGLKHGITSFTSKMVAQWLFADMIYILQLYVMYKRLQQNRLATPEDTLDRILLAVDLIPSLGVFTISTLFFFHDVCALGKAYPDFSSETRPWVLAVLEWTLLGGCPGLLYFIVTSV